MKRPAAAAVAAGVLAGLLLLGGVPAGARPLTADETLFLDAQVRGRVEYRDNRDFSGDVGDELTTWMSRLRLGLRYRPTDDWDLRFQLQDTRATPGRARRLPNESGLEVHELYARHSGLAGGRVGLTLGRQPLSYGNQRLVGPFEWSNVARRFDAFKVDWSFGGGRLDAWVSTLGWSPGTETADGEFYGLYATWPNVGGGTLDAYSLLLHDPSLPFTNTLTFGGRYARRIGAWSYDAEAAVQTADVSAWALALEGGRRIGPADVRLGLNVASGDSSPVSGAGGKGTFQNLFPTNHLHYGYMDYQSWRNTINLQLRASAEPLSWLGTTLQWNAFWLQNDRDFWYGANGRPNMAAGGVPFRDPSGAARSYVGQEIDLVLRSQPYDRLNLEFGYGHFFAGDFIRDINRSLGVGTSDSDWVYFQVTGTY